MSSDVQWHLKLLRLSIVCCCRHNTWKSQAVDITQSPTQSWPGRPSGKSQVARWQVALDKPNVSKPASTLFLFVPATHKALPSCAKYLHIFQMLSAH